MGRVVATIKHARVLDRYAPGEVSGQPLNPVWPKTVMRPERDAIRSTGKSRIEIGKRPAIIVVGLQEEDMDDINLTQGELK